MAAAVASTAPMCERRLKGMVVLPEDLFIPLYSGELATFRPRPRDMTLIKAIKAPEWLLDTLTVQVNGWFSHFSSSYDHKREDEEDPAAKYYEAKHRIISVAVDKFMQRYFCTIQSKERRTSIEEKLRTDIESGLDVWLRRHASPSHAVIALIGSQFEVEVS
jgi:hypothetical protein